MSIPCARPRVLFAWEQGGGLGHLARIAPLARRLLELGAHVHVAAKDLARAATLLPPPVRLHPCPPRTARAAVVPQYNYAAVLAKGGWLDTHGLRGMLRAWDALFDDVRPDVLVCDFAPTALLASTGRAIARCAVGNGFDLPPLASPLPPMSWWEPCDEATMAGIERAVLQALNAVLGERGVPSFERLAELFDCDWRAAATHAAFDVYPSRAPGDLEFLGPVDTGIGGLRPAWPGTPGGRAFVYLRGHAACVEATVAALRALRLPGLVYAPGMPRAAADDLSTRDVRIHTEPLDLAHALGGADMVVTHSGSGLGALALAEGKPLVLFPMVREQLMSAMRLGALGVARHVMPDRLDHALAALQAIAGTPEPAQRARQLAATLPCRPQACDVAARRLLRHAHARRAQADGRAGGSTSAGQEDDQQ